MSQRLLIVICVIAGCFGSAAAETTQEKFDKVFADKVRQAKRTVSKRDDAALAGEFVKVAEMIDGEGDLKIMLYQNAVEFGAKDPAGHESAAKAIELLKEIAPDRKTEWDALGLGILKSIY